MAYCKILHGAFNSFKFYRERKKMQLLFLKLISLLSSLSMTYLGVIEAYKVEKSCADKSPLYWQIILFKASTKPDVLLSPSPLPAPSLFPAYIFPISVCHFFLLRF